MDFERVPMLAMVDIPRLGRMNRTRTASWQVLRRRYRLSKIHFLKEVCSSESTKNSCDVLFSIVTGHENTRSNNSSSHAFEHHKTPTCKGVYAYKAHEIPQCALVPPRRHHYPVLRVIELCITGPCTPFAIGISFQVELPLMTGDPHISLDPFPWLLTIFG